MVLDHVLVGGQRVDLNTDGQPGDRVHRAAHQVRLQVDRLALACRLLPARHQPLRHALQRREVLLDVRRVEAGHHHAALAAPGLAAGTEGADRHPHLGPDLLELQRAARAVGAIAQRTRDEWGARRARSNRCRRPHVRTRSRRADPRLADNRAP
ncbi:MAG: hypothetical protein MUF03_02415 [Rubrivivax sp.]|nr:hypothetical protein [Rubrivivax sp.]